MTESPALLDLLGRPRPIEERLPTNEGSSDRSITYRVAVKELKLSYNIGETT